MGCVDPTPGVVSGPVLPERSAEVFCGAQRLVSSLFCRAALLPGAPVLPDRNYWDGLPFGNGRVAAGSVVGTNGGQGTNLLVRRDLAEQLVQDRAVTVATGVNSTARMSEVAVSMARCTLRH